MHDRAINRGKSKPHAPKLLHACKVVSMATETCILGKQLVDWSNFCTNSKNFSDHVLPVLMLRQCSGVETGNSQKKIICINSNTKKLNAILLKWPLSSASRFRYKMAG